MKSIALAALLLTTPALAQVVSGDQDTDHNTDWRSARWVAPKQVETYSLYIVIRWPTTQVMVYGGYASFEACEAVRGSLSFDTRVVTTSCGL